MNYAAHVSFVNKCLAKYANEGKFPWCDCHDPTDEDHSHRTRTTFLRGTLFTPERPKSAFTGVLYREWFVPDSELVHQCIRSRIMGVEFGVAAGVRNEPYLSVAPICSATGHA